MYKGNIKIDSNYGRKIAMGLLDYKTNEKGFRLAGSPAENEAADWIAHEMEQIGLSNVTKESFPVDGWIFNGAEGKAFVEGKELMSFEAGLFSGSFGTDEKGIKAPVIYLGEGTADQYDLQNAEGKIVLIDTNAFMYNWYDVVFKQAQLRGAIAVMAMPLEPNPGTYSEDIITIHEMETKIDIPAISISVKTGTMIKDALKNGNVEVEIKADVEINRDAEAHFVTGMIPGKNPDRYIVLAGHYDAYWDGLLDNASSLGSQLCIAKALLDMGYEPESNILFSINGAEEFGHMDTLFAWMTGSDAMCRMHPELMGKTILLLNIECSALKQDTKLGFSAADVYHTVMHSYCEEITEKAEGKYVGHYLEGVGTGGDDFIFSLSGLPTLLHKAVDVYTDFKAGGFMSLYHTSKDNEELFNQEYFDLNNHIFCDIILRFDRLLCAPMDFSYFYDEFWRDVDKNEIGDIYDRYEELENELKILTANLSEWYAYATEVNEKYSSGDAEEAVKNEAWEISRKLLNAYETLCTDVYKVDIFMERCMGHIIVYDRYKDICNLLEALNNDPANSESIEKATEAFLEKGYNHLIPEFDKEVYLTRNVMPFKPESQKYFAEGKTVEYRDLYDVIKSIMAKYQEKKDDFDNEIKILNDVIEEERKLLVEMLDNELVSIKRINQQK